MFETIMILKVIVFILLNIIRTKSYDGVSGNSSIWLNSSAHLISVVWVKGNKLQYREFDYQYGSVWSDIINLNLPSGYVPDSVPVESNIPPAIQSSLTTGNRITPNLYLSVVLRVRNTHTGEIKLMHLVYDLDTLQNPENPYAYYIIDSGDVSAPSLAYSNVRILKLHCVWCRDKRIYYSEFQYGQNWTPAYQISHTNPDIPAYNPSIEVYGDSLYAVWSEDEGTGKHDVWRRRKKVTNPPDIWYPQPEPISENSYNFDSRYPTNSELRFCLWLEEDHSNTDYDPWYRYNGDPPAVFYNTSEESYFPHANRYNAGYAIWLYGIWTEKVYTLLKEKLIAPGTYKTEFKKPENLKSGIYFIKLNSDYTKEVKKIIFSR